MNWVTVTKFAELSGYSVKAIHCKIDQGVWVYGVHWKHAPDNRRIISVAAVEAWMQGVAA